MGSRSPLLKPYADIDGWSLLDATPDATLVVSATGDIVFANDHANALFGYRDDDLVDRPVEDLVPEALRSRHRAHRTRFRADPEVRAMAAGLDLWARRADGSEFPAEISLSPLNLGDELFIVAGVRDITERVKAEDWVRRVMHTLDSTEDALFIFDAETLRYSFVNDGAVRLVGYSREELLAMTPLHINLHTTETEYRQLVDQLVASGGAAVPRESQLIRRDGQEIAVENTLRSAPLARDGTSWIIVVARDISGRLAAEQELEVSRRALHDMELAAQRSQVLYDERERIARDLHDTVIQRLFAAGLGLQGTVGTVGDERTRDRIHSTIAGLDDAIKDLRTMVFRLQSSAAPPTAGGLRGQLLDVVADASEGLGFEPRLQFDGPIETMDEHIADHLLAVLREGLSNTAKHARADNVRVAVTVTDFVTLTVTDDGVGVPDEVYGGHGVANMTHRARELGGEFTIDGDPTNGSRLIWRVPTAKPA